MTNNKLRLICFAAALIFHLFNAVSFADLLFQITATQNTLAVGEEATISIWANIEEQTTGLNGLNVWQLDMVVDTDSVVQVSADPVLIAPTPIDPASGWVSYNDGSTGNVYGLGVFTPGPQDSNTGVGDFSLLAQVTIEAIGSVGEQVTYELTDYTLTTGFYGILRDGQNYDVDYASPWAVEFQPGNNVFTIVPEPGSLLIMTFMAGFALKSRKLGIGR